MTPEDVRRARFGFAAPGREAYHRGQVDAFCARIADSLIGRDNLTAADIRMAEFDTPVPGNHGYDCEQVDEFLDQICVDLEFLRRGSHRIPSGREQDPLTHEAVLRIQFSAPPLGFTGYVADEVGAFLDRLAATLAHDGPNGLTPDEVRDTVFPTATGATAAYHKPEVDAFLDLVAHQLKASR
ncbi:DivIVA domain-containing protein [Nocardia jejuensis]|uniref:DivIVA domain-containing protein n=1 Tax=Nocardia jejuensis TaxID=328049 RepID=UPI001C3F4F79|nr:DivIVA domain-containing protein [Nocardia jejuensis]